MSEGLDSYTCACGGTYLEQPDSKRHTSCP
jgi:hypothetical protein